MRVGFAWLRWGLPTLMLVVGLLVTLVVHDTVKRDARENWEENAERVSQWLSAAALGWLEESYAMLSGMATLYENSSLVSEQEFYDAFDGLEFRSAANFLDTIAVAELFGGAEDPQNWIVNYSSDPLGTLPIGSSLADSTSLWNAHRAGAARFGRTILGAPYENEFGEPVSPVVIVLETPNGLVSVIGILNYQTLISGLEVVLAPEGTALSLSGRFPDTQGRGEKTSVGGEPLETFLYATTTRTISADADLTFNWRFNEHFGGGPDRAFSNTVLWAGLIITGLVTLVVAGLMARNREVTRRVQTATADLERQGELLSAVLKSIRQGLAAFDKDLKLVVANDRFKQIREVPDRLATPGATFEEWMHHDAAKGEFGDGDPEEQARIRIAKARQFQHHRLIRTRPDGTVLEIEGGPLPGGGFVSTFSDITQRKRAEEALEKAYDTISASIDYASHLQRAILPPQSRIDEIFPDFFSLWRPRDIVGGDMYWVRKWGDGTLVALGDCTGHGVPGAFMTLIASAALDHAMHEVPPGAVAELMQGMHAYIQESLGQDTDDGESDDGMEVGICYIRPGREQMQYCGARFSLFVFDGETVREVKGGRKGIGYPGIAPDQRYPVESIPLNADFCYYMTTDGLLDQIGGEKRLGFGRRRFARVLGDVGRASLAEQKSHLEDSIRAYQGKEASRDDVAVIGFRVAQEGGGR